MSTMADFDHEYDQQPDIKKRLASGHQPPIADSIEELEQYILGGIFINDAAYYDAARIIEDDFFTDLRNEVIWQACKIVKAQGGEIDIVTVSEQLRLMPSKIGMKNMLDEIGGAAYLVYVLNTIGTSQHTEILSSMLERHAIRRRMIDAGDEIKRLAMTETDAFEAYEKGRKLYDMKISRRQQRSGLRPIAESISMHFDRVEDLYNHPKKLPGIPSGFTEVDNILHGFRAEDLILLAARPGVGKTAWMLNVLKNAAMRRFHCALFSLEMSESQLLNRMISAETGIPSMKIGDGKLSESEWGLYVEATGTIADLPIFIDDTPNLKVSQIRQKSSYLRNLGKLDFVMVDHMQLIGGSAPDEERMLTVGNNSWELKMLAKELKVPVLVASQLSRAVEQRADKRPMLSDLSESGRLEQNADQVLFIYRDELYNENTERPNEADIIIGKNRHGATGTATLFFRKQLTQFANLKKTEVHLGDFEL